MTEINIEQFSNQQRILITGVSGLIGRILFNYLTKTYPTKYEVFGLDQHMNISWQYQEKNDENLQLAPILPLSLDKFFQCDITDRTKLYQIIQEQQIDIIIHLAALLESHPDIEEISRINIEGTKNVFEARESLSFIFI
jgi:nucleoside-diphosphate-sugar epimerase